MAKVDVKNKAQKSKPRKPSGNAAQKQQSIAPSPQNNCESLEERTRQFLVECLNDKRVTVRMQGRDIHVKDEHILDYRSMREGYYVVVTCDGRKHQVLNGLDYR